MLLQDCGLPEVWRGQAQWRILETGFGNGQHFLLAWHAWRADPQRPRLLHYCAIDASPVSAQTLRISANTHPEPCHSPPPELTALAEALALQWDGLLPGFHRIALEGGQVLLTLCVGEAKAMLRELAFSADSVLLTSDANASPEAAKNTAWPGLASPDVHTLKAIARCCVRGTRFASEHSSPALPVALAQCGFVVEPERGEGLPASVPAERGLRGVFAPHWEPKRRGSSFPGAQFVAGPRPEGRCVVIGAGLAGAAVAASLARRGWHVQVLDTAAQPAQGASGVPAGLLVPHVSPDDSVLSRLSRSGARISLEQARTLLRAGQDWQPSGVLEHRVDGSAGLGKFNISLHEASAAWSRPASAEQLLAAGLPADTVALWHPCAAWIKPAALVAALLTHPRITWQGNCEVAALQRQNGQDGPESKWQAFDRSGQVVAQADLIVIAAAYASQALLAPQLSRSRLPLQALRGQVSWGRYPLTEDQGPATAAVPPSPQVPMLPFPVNGNGNLIPWVPDAEGPMWALGSTFERDQSAVQSSAEDTARRHRDNHRRLQVLLPRVARQLTGLPEAQAFIGIRCAAPDRLPVVGQIAVDSNADATGQGLWVSTAMGSRGLSFALLCAELLAAQLHGEPWPIEKRLAQALAPARFAQNPQRE